MQRDKAVQRLQIHKSETLGKFASMKYSGKYGEYRVLALLLELDIEAYPAIKTNQHDYDITAVLSTSRVVRIQVKTTELNNRCTNNAIDRVDKNYDYLVVVIVDVGGNTTFYIMSKSEALAAKGIPLHTSPASRCWP